MDELHKSQLKEEGKFTAERFADEVALMSAENVRRYLRRGPENYPDHWKDLGVVAYKVNKRDWMIEIAAKPDELVASYRVKKLPPVTVDTLQKLGELATFIEERLPIAEVVAHCEQQLPIQEVAARVRQFVQEAPPVGKVLGEILRTSVSK